MFKFHTISKWLEDIHRNCLHKYKTKISSKTFFINPHIPSKHFPLQNYFPNRCPKLEKRLSSRFPTQSMDWKFLVCLTLFVYRKFLNKFYNYQITKILIISIQTLCAQIIPDLSRKMSKKAIKRSLAH